jgi:DNA-binding response OmpR family regulator
MKVLVIDDDLGMTDLLAILLAPASSEVIAANSADQGIEMTRQHTPDVVILDLMLPELDGWKVCNVIRSFSDVPILILSAIDSPGMIAEALDNGADDFLTKPISSGTLIAHLNKLVRRPKLQKKTIPAPEAS